MAPASPLPIADMLRELDTEDQSPAKQPETRMLAIANESHSEAKLPMYSTSEMPGFSRSYQALTGNSMDENIDDQMKRYAGAEDVETTSLYGLEEPDYVQQAKRMEHVRRRRREKAIDEAIEEDPELEEYLRPKAETHGEQQQGDEPRQRPHLGKWTQSGPAEQRTTLAQDQGDGQVKLRPTKREPLPGMGRPKRTPAASAASSKPAGEVPLGTSSGSSTWSGFSLLPGMPLPFEQDAASSASRWGAGSKAPAAGSGIAAADKGGRPSSSRQHVSSRTLAEKLRNHRQRVREDDDEAELQEAFESIGGSRGHQSKRAPAKSFPKSLARATAKASMGSSLPKYEDLFGALDSLDKD